MKILHNGCMTNDEDMGNSSLDTIPIEDDNVNTAVDDPCNDTISDEESINDYETYEERANNGDDLKGE